MVTFNQLIEKIYAERAVRKNHTYITPIKYDITDTGLQFSVPATFKLEIQYEIPYSSYTLEGQIQDIRMCDLKHTFIMQDFSNRGYLVYYYFYITYADSGEAEICVKCTIDTKEQNFLQAPHIVIIHLYYIFSQLNIPYIVNGMDFLSTEEVVSTIATICKWEKPEYLKILREVCNLTGRDCYCTAFAQGCEDAIGINNSMNTYLLEFAKCGSPHGQGLEL